MAHRMNLIKVYFNAIEKGIKTVEMRLNDEKRKGIKICDIICFGCDGDSNRYMSVRVVGRREFSDFTALASAYDRKTLGFGGQSAEAVGAFMTSLYGESAVKENGVVALEIEKI